jgi:peptidoglycan/xylan/chitin deacetylase (PgdA/CDA1 family)
MAFLWTIVACVAGLVAVGSLYVYAWSEPSAQIFGPALVRGSAAGGRVALTFDDGPASPFTERILDILRDRKVTATFFVCGRNVQRCPEILRRIHSEGHEIGNHTYSHPFFYFRSRSFMAAEIDRTQELIEGITGERPVLFRPPFGVRWLGIYTVLRERGLCLVTWSDTGYDWKSGTEDIVRKTLNGLGAGSIILLHDGRRTYPPGKIDQSSTVSALPAIIDGVLRAGLTFVSVSNLVGGTRARTEVRE